VSSADVPWDDRFCFYCQRQFVTLAGLKRHLTRFHEGTYAYHAIVLGEPVR